LQITSTTKFPFDPKVLLSFTLEQPQRSRVRVRVPSWSAKEMAVIVNGKETATGQPGSYVVLDRVWQHGDEISFTLPMELKLTRYEGLDKIAGQERYALEYGPILLALDGSQDAHLVVKGGTRHQDIVRQLRPKFGEPLHFEVAENAGRQFVPYLEVKSQLFTCYPVIELA
jgi:DUF1680 family protein